MARTLPSIFFVALVGLSVVSVALAQDNVSVREAVPPIYPAIALSARATGAVIIEVQIDSAGSVTAARAISGAAVLRPISEFTARRWLFAPSDTAATRSVRLTFRFTIVADGTNSKDRVPIFRPPYEVEARDEVPHIVQTPNIDPGPKRKRNRS
jgi:Gram-negative bacterial TonB protein C-terminal